MRRYAPRLIGAAVAVAALAPPALAWKPASRSERAAILATVRNAHPRLRLAQFGPVRIADVHLHVSPGSHGCSAFARAEFTYPKSHFLEVFLCLYVQRNPTRAAWRILDQGPGDVACTYRPSDFRGHAGAILSDLAFEC